MAEPASANGRVDGHEATSARRWWSVALRLLVLIVGGYAAASALVAATARILPVTGLVRSEAVALASMGGFLFYLALLVWGFSRPRLMHLVFGFMLAGGFGLSLVLATRG